MLGTCVCLREPKREALCRERFCRREERGESSTLRMLVKCMTTAFIGLTPMKMRAYHRGASDSLYSTYEREWGGAQARKFSFINVRIGDFPRLRALAAMRNLPRAPGRREARGKLDFAYAGEMYDDCLHWLNTNGDESIPPGSLGPSLFNIREGMGWCAST